MHHEKPRNITANQFDDGGTQSMSIEAPTTITVNQLAEGDLQSVSIIVGDVYEAIKDIGSELEQKQIARWFKENFEEEEVFENLKEALDSINNSVTNLVSNETLQQIIEIVRNLF
ncbi:MAG: hypothetical protein L3J98_08985 [Gammaproteobacteria bacterium]|nr:hypothetical protein [Gammaproteobacteria bacterium]MCF6260276.1 hypothetical protein [Gammaproteobacteria bacterium]